MGLFGKKQLTPEQIERGKHFISSFWFYHVTGLPVAPYASCNVIFYDDMLTVTSQEIVFNLPIERIINMSNEYDMSLQGIGKGGSVKRAAVVTYSKDDEIKYIVFSDKDMTLGYGSFSKDFKNLKKLRGETETREVDL